MNNFIYALSNKTSPDIYYIGCTYKNPLKIRKRITDKHLGTESNETVVFTYDFAKRGIHTKETILQWYAVLSRYGKRLYPRKNLFQISRNEIKMFMEQIDGEWLTDKNPCDEKVLEKPISDHEIAVDWLYEDPEFLPVYTNPLTEISVYVG
jgi:hypothetical protein